MQTVMLESSSPQSICRKAFPACSYTQNLGSVEKEGPFWFPRESGERGRAKL